MYCLGNTSRWIVKNISLKKGFNYFMCFSYKISTQVACLSCMYIQHIVYLFSYSFILDKFEPAELKKEQLKGKNLN